MTDEVPDCCLSRKLCYHIKYPDAARNGDTQNGIATARKSPERELLSFNLKRMRGKLDLMTEGMSRFRRDLQHWRRYHEDRSTVGDYSPWVHSVRK